MREVSYNLNTRLLGRKIFCYKSTGSTNDIARLLARRGIEEGGVVFAENQTSARGRRQRRWVCQEGGLYMSVILRPPESANNLAGFYLLSSVALALAIRKVSSLDCFIKWPNDIMINGGKAAGILAEAEIRDEKTEFLILGIGVNVNLSSDNLPPGSATLLDESGIRYSRVELAKEILRELEKQYFLFKEEGIKPVIEKWYELSRSIGSRISINTGKDLTTGMAVGLDEESGALLLRKDSGLIEKIMSAEDI
ncbi:MAG: biotin--[acetyl-CoA-carboxylase] ligase [Candidatus Omnitrophica bacterium]|nr:biotin--[acetyl-CoA-carboxylase] ligase [Candidatus Omnitrophota bacterium]